MEKYYARRMKFELSAESAQTMRSPVARLAVLALIAAAVVLAFQIIRILV